MIINNINDNGSGPWGNGGNQNPWGKRPNSNGTPPDVDQMLKESKDKLKKMMPSGFGGGKGLLILLFIIVFKFFFLSFNALFISFVFSYLTH